MPRLPLLLIVWLTSLSQLLQQLLTNAGQHLPHPVQLFQLTGSATATKLAPVLILTAPDILTITFILLRLPGSTLRLLPRLPLLLIVWLTSLSKLLQQLLTNAGQHLPHPVQLFQLTRFATTTTRPHCLIPPAPDIPTITFILLRLPGSTLRLLPRLPLLLIVWLTSLSQLLQQLLTNAGQHLPHPVQLFQLTRFA